MIPRTQNRMCLTWMTLGCIISLSASDGSLGDTPLEVSEQAYLQTPPVVISATQLVQPVSEAPASVTVIDRSAIAAMGARNIPELMRRVVGVTVAYENGSNPVVSYQGLNSGLSKRMQVLVDGRSVYNPFFGGVLWESLPLELEDIERIEFVRGPNAAIDGANAFLATINIKTRHSSEDQGLHAKTRIGNNGMGEGYLRYGGVHDTLSYRFSGAYNQDYGLDTRNDNVRGRYLSGRVDWNITPTHSITALAGYKASDLGQGFQTQRFSILKNPFEACFPEHNRNIGNYFGQLRFDSMPSPDRQTTLQLYYERVTSLADYPLNPRCGGVNKQDDYFPSFAQ